MFEDIELSNCPDKFALNCKNYQTKCFKCKANNKSGYLLYAPINNTIINHPASIVQKSKVQSYSSKGRAKEKALIASMDYLYSTKGSGSVLGDGDAYLLLNGIGKVRVEIKSRFTNKTNIKPTLKELREGKSQNINIFIISNVTQNKNYFYINYKLFSEMWKVCILKSYKFAPVFFERSCKNYFNYYITPYENEHFILLKISNEFRVPTHYYEIFIIKTKAGYYVGMYENTFNTFIDLYQTLTK